MMAGAEARRSGLCFTKGIAMFAKDRKKGGLRFAVNPGPEVRKVMVAGNYDDWNPKRMRKQKDGSFVALVPLRPGSYEYKFLFDDRWVVDPDNGAWSLNPYGTMNSVASVE